MYVTRKLEGTIMSSGHTVSWMQALLFMIVLQLRAMCLFIITDIKLNDQKLAHS